jgi:hypothetical protein
MGRGPVISAPGILGVRVVEELLQRTVIESAQLIIGIRIVGI